MLLVPYLFFQKIEFPLVRLIISGSLTVLFSRPVFPKLISISLVLLNNFLSSVPVLSSFVGVTSNPSTPSETFVFRFPCTLVWELSVSLSSYMAGSTLAGLVSPTIGEVHYVPLVACRCRLLEWSSPSSSSWCNEHKTVDTPSSEIRCGSRYGLVGVETGCQSIPHHDCHDSKEEIRINRDLRVDDEEWG